MRIVVVDDEKGIRDYIGKMPHWREAGCEVVGLAANGQEALECIRMLRPDLVVTDIMMPVMDGIELASRIRQEYRGMPVMFLTAYGEFEYAQQAVKLGVVDFITKPFQPEVLVKSVKLLEPYALRQHEWVWQDEFFAYFGSGNYSDVAKQSWLEVRGIAARPYMLMYVDLDQSAVAEAYSGAPISRLRLKDRIEAELGQGGWSYWSALSASGIYFLLFDRKEQIPPVSASDIMESARTILSLLGGSSSGSVSIGISEPMESFLQLPEAIRQVKQCMEYRMLLGNGSLIAYEALDDLYIRQTERRHHMIQEFMKLIGDGRWEEANDYLQASYKQMLLDGFNKTEIRNANLLIVEALEAEQRLYGIEPTAAERVERREKLLESNVLTEMVQLLRDFMQETQVQICEKQDESTSRLYAQASRLIRDHYAEDLTLQMIAEKLNVNYSYLSRIIKKESERNFRDILRECRLEEARKKLLQTDLMVYEIAYAVGFKDPQHFSEAFKLQYGRGPMAYREEMRQGKE